MHIVQGFAGAVIDICIEQQLHTRSLCSRIEFFKFPIVIDSGTVNFSYMFVLCNLCKSNYLYLFISIEISLSKICKIVVSLSIAVRSNKVTT